MLNIIKKFILYILCISLILNIISGIAECNSKYYNSINKVTKYIENKEKIPLSKSKIDYILSLPKGERPDPKTYLNKKYIKDHLKLFSNGISIIVGLDTYYKYIAYNIFIGRDDNTCFVMPTYICDNIDKIAKGDLSIWEEKLSFTKGYFTNQGGIIRLDIYYIKDLNLRMASGNELGANEYWIPGGYTIGGIPEAVTDKIPVDRAKIIKYNNQKKIYIG